MRKTAMNRYNTSSGDRPHMSEEQLYDVIPKDVSEEAQAFAVECTHKEALKYLKEANELFREYGIEYAIAESNGEREVTKYRQRKMDEE